MKKNEKEIIGMPLVDWETMWFESLNVVGSFSIAHYGTVCNHK